MDGAWSMVIKRTTERRAGATYIEVNEENEISQEVFDKDLNELFFLLRYKYRPELTHGLLFNVKGTYPWYISQNINGLLIPTRTRIIYPPFYVGGKFGRE